MYQALGAMPEGKFFVSKLHTASSGCRGRQESGNYEKPKNRWQRWGPVTAAALRDFALRVHYCIMIARSLEFNHWCHRGSSP